MDGKLHAATCQELDGLSIAEYRKHYYDARANCSAVKAMESLWSETETDLSRLDVPDVLEASLHHAITPNDFLQKVVERGRNVFRHVWNHHVATTVDPAELERRKVGLRDFGQFICLQKRNSGSLLDGRISPKMSEWLSTARDPWHHFVNSTDTYDYFNYSVLGRCNISLEVTIEGIPVRVIMPFTLAEELLGLEITEDLKLRLANGEEGFFNERLVTAYRARKHWTADWDVKFDFTYTTLSGISHRIGASKENVKRLLKGLVKKGIQFSDPEMSGIKKLWSRLAPLAVEMMPEDPMAFCALRTLASQTHRTVDSVKISSVFNEIFSAVQNKDDLLNAIRDFYVIDGEEKSTTYDVDQLIRNTPSFRDKRRAVLKNQANRAFSKVMEEVESLTIDREKYSLTWAKIESGDLPIGTFFRKKEQYFLLNDNWELWEEMFKRGYGEEACALANEVKGRSTYEKDLMSYFYFILYSLPEYLEKHTGCKWKCKPRLVNSQNELEPPKEDEEGVARKRSALTPTVDNEAKTVEVPYASLAIGGGYGTTYCYSHDYHVLTKGFSFMGNVVMDDLERKLNGRDDYGLMFYTLTGSEMGRGYPTFLIIFERRERFVDTRVHFHRCHPSRSKEGDYNPIHAWIRVCYNWVAGNIRRERIKAQQGDLFFVQVKTNESDALDGPTVNGLSFEHKVDQYDHHVFKNPVPFAEYTKATKSNILGYVRLDEDTLLTHNEHDDVLIPAGTYAIHQCRSWEANPQGVWTLRID